MGYSKERLREIFNKTGGYCYFCGKRLSFDNYGQNGSWGAWQVDHSVPLSKGGTDNLHNLNPACIECNTDKSDRTGQSYKRSIEVQTIKQECFIATAAMDSGLHPHVQLLRKFRDNILLQSRYKDTFASLLKRYYRFSPPIARAISRNLYLKLFLRYTLVYPIVYTIKIVLPIFDVILGIQKDAKIRKMLKLERCRISMTD